MHRFFKWLNCVLSGHPLRITHLEMLNDQLYPVRESCRCGSVGTPINPGYLLKAWKDHYEAYQPEFVELFRDDTN